MRSEVSQRADQGGSGGGSGAPAAEPGKRTRTMGIPSPSSPVQRKAAGAGSSAVAAPALGSAAASPVDDPFAMHLVDGPADDARMDDPRPTASEAQQAAVAAEPPAAPAAAAPDGASPAAAAPGKTAATADPAAAGGGKPVPGRSGPEGLSDAPTARYIVPFDRAPLAAPGERIICRAEFTGATAADYEIVYTTVGGHFTSAAGPTEVVIQGLTSGNVNFYVPTPWDGSAAVTIVMQLRKKSDSSIAQTETWNFGKKAYYPTTMTQREDTGERDLPGIYTYDIGPARAGATAPFYQHQTILEWFDAWSIPNIAPEDINEAYRTTHGLTSTAAITSHTIGAYAGNNGTFTVDANDRVGDRHNGTPNVDRLVNNLVRPKDIEVALPQTYEAQPGTALQRYTVTRVRKADGTWKVKKAPR